MSNEELMRPRYKVIATWPGMHVEPFHVGQIVTLQPHTEEDAEGFIYVPNKHVPKSFMWQSFFDLFPHLFKKLEWWEERKREEMPEYVKHEHGWIDKHIGINHAGDSFVFIGQNDVIEWRFKHFTPATATEYEQYINQKEKQ